MFNWFKRKVELKNENSIMTSTYIRSGIKVGSEIIVPDNFKCLIFNNGKYYLSLDSGKHKVTSDKFEQLILAQSKIKHKKYIKMVCHYINLSPQTITIKFKKHKFIVKFNISDTLAFANLLLLYTFKVDGNYTLNTLNDIFIEALSWSNGNSSIIDEGFFKDYGITITSFEPENKKQSIFTQNSESMILNHNHTERKDDALSCQNAVMDKSQPIEQSDTVKDITSDIPKVKFPECPKCKNVAKFNTTYCLRCGYKLE